MIFTLLLVICFGVLAGMNIRARLRSRRVKNTNWETLVKGLQPVSFENIQVLARNYLEPQKGQLDLEPRSMWQLLGGTEGLPSLRANAEIMIDLAAYIQQTNFEEGTIVTETMRRDAVRLRKAISNIETAMLLNLRRHMIPFYVNEVASSYYLMRQRLLALYENCHAGLLPQLAAAL